MMIPLIMGFCLSITFLSAQTLPDSTFSQPKYTFISSSTRDTAFNPKDTNSSRFLFTTRDHLQTQAVSHGFDPTELGQGYFNLQFDQFSQHSILPPLINDLGIVSMMDMVDHDSLTVITHPLQSLTHISITPTYHQRYETYILMSVLPCLIPAMLYVDTSTEIFLTSYLFASIYAPLAITSLGFYESRAQLVYEGESYFNASGQFQIKPGISTGYMPNILFKHYRYENEFRLVPVLGLNMKIVHNRSPAQFSLGLYYATVGNNSASADEYGQEVSKKKNRILINSGMNYPLITTDRLYLDLETGLSATHSSLSSPYLRFNWSPKIGGQHRLSFSHHLLMGSGYDLDSFGSISGWPLLHTLNFSILNQPHYQLRSDKATKWCIGMGIRDVPRVYHQQDHTTERLPCITLSKQIGDRTLVAFEGGIGPEKHSDKLQSENEWLRQTIQTNHQLFFTSMRMEGIYHTQNVDMTFGVGIRYLIEFLEKEEERFYLETWEERTWYEDSDLSQIGFLLTSALNRDIIGGISGYVGLDADCFKLFEVIVDDPEKLSSAITAKAGFEFNLSKWAEGR